LHDTSVALGSVLGSKKKRREGYRRQVLTFVEEWHREGSAVEGSVYVLGTHLRLSIQC
jgi:hypothetical protein